MGDSLLIDPLGRSIHLYNHTFYGHIVKGHPEMRRQRAQIEAAISNPREIRHSPADPDCRMYFGAGPRAGIMIVVIADVVRGFVKTAHFVKQAKGTIEWSAQTP